MKVQTKHFGEVELPETRVISFAKGLIGFERATRFVLLDAAHGETFKWLQCVDDPSLCFLVVEPVSFMFNYTLEIPDSTAAELGIENPEEVLIYALVVVPKEPERISANLCGPLVINARPRLGEQVVSSDPAHGVRHYILEEMKRNAERLFGAGSAPAVAADRAAPPPEPAAKPAGGGR